MPANFIAKEPIFLVLIIGGEGTLVHDDKIRAPSPRRGF